MGCISSLPTNVENSPSKNTYGGVYAVKMSDKEENNAKPTSDSGDSKVNLMLEKKRIAISQAEKDNAPRRADIFGEKVCLDAPFEIEIVEKQPEICKFIMNALKQNILFSTFTETQLTTMVDAMSVRETEKDGIIIKQGDNGDFFYIVQEGRYSVEVNNQEVTVLAKEGIFGELALLYNCPRAATIKCIEKGVLWALHRTIFRRIIASEASDLIKECKDSLQRIKLLEPLTEQQIDQLAEIIQIVNFKKDEQIIRKGEIGNILYIIRKGTVICTDVGDGNTRMEPLRLTEEDYFGERALLTNELRAANVTAETDVVAMALDREAFNSVLGPLREVLEHNMGLRVLNTVPLLKPLRQEEREKLISAFYIAEFAEGEHIIHQGEEGSTFYIVQYGHVAVKKSGNESKPEDEENKIEIGKLGPGDYFGEQSLLHSEPRNADIIAIEPTKCFVLHQAQFIELLGPLQDILNREAARLDMNTSKRNKFSDLDKMKNGIVYELNQFEFYRTLGTGTFGHVKLVRYKPTNKFFALKILQKAQIVAYKQQENVLNEKRILQMCNHPFIVNLHQTFKDDGHLYYLLDFVEGGELFNYLHCFPARKTHQIPNEEAMFYASNVILALEYVHAQNICYRDLKPENLLIDINGYIKVADFGFAKIISSRTYTLCGTPEYLAPELVLGKGHGKGVDYWAFGILVYEMVNGVSPFAASNPSDQMQICRNILDGRFTFPKHIKKSCRELIDKLLVSDPTKRLGCLSDGVEGIKNHAWFNDIDFKAFVEKTYTPPYVPPKKHPTQGSNEAYEEEDGEWYYQDDGSNWDKDF